MPVDVHVQQGFLSTVGVEFVFDFGVITGGDLNVALPTVAVHVRFNAKGNGVNVDASNGGADAVVHKIAPKVRDNGGGSVMPTGQWQRQGMTGQVAAPMGQCQWQTIGWGFGSTDSVNRRWRWLGDWVVAAGDGDCFCVVVRLVTLYGSAGVAVLMGLLLWYGGADNLW